MTGKLIKDIYNILDDVYYWESCPQEYNNKIDVIKKELEAELKKIRLGDVSGRSEQLVSFLQWYVKDEAKRDEPNKISDIVERYLKETNCH